MHTITMPTSGPYAAVAALMATPLPIPPDAPPRAALAAEIERLIAILDLIDGDPDLEETGDLEPSLAGAPSYPLDAEFDESEREPSLGSLDRAMDQRQWNGGAADDREGDDPDDEPNLGWSNPLGARVDDCCRLIVESVPTKHVRRPEVRP